MSRAAASLTAIARRLSSDCAALAFGPPVEHVYNPLSYGWEAHRAYLELCAAAKPSSAHREVLLLGMNPGPFGMVQTALPFGDVTFARDFLGIDRGVTPPADMHPARPIEGFECSRSEVSGTRFWGWVHRRFGSPEAFLSRFFVWNWCPLAFLEASGRNRTPDKLAAHERAALTECCHHALREIIDVITPKIVVGVGAFAESCARRALADHPSPPRFGRILHPSPASPAANRNWMETAEGQLRALEITLPAPQ